MKRTVLIASILAVCICLTSCGYLAYSISGEIMDPVAGFARGSDDDTFVFGGKNYIKVDVPLYGFAFFVSREDVLLGQRSNFPFFANYEYYANATENPEYISCSAGGTLATAVYFREDLYQTPFSFVLAETDCEYDPESAFVKTEEVSYKNHIENNKYDDIVVFDSYLKGYPRLTLSTRIYKIGDKWYGTKNDEMFVLTEDFLSALAENDLLTDTF